MRFNKRAAAITATVLTALLVTTNGCISVGNGNGRSVATADGMKTNMRAVRVLLYPDGHLDTGNLYIGADQISTLAKEIAGSTVELSPVAGGGQSVTLEQAIRVRDQLLKNGVKRVILPMGN